MDHGEHQLAAARELTEQRHDHLRVLRRETRGRLVEEEQLGIREQLDADVQSLSLTAGQHLPHRAADAQVPALVEAGVAQHARDARGQLLAAQVRQPQTAGVAQVLLDRQVVHDEIVLRDVAEDRPIAPQLRRERQPVQMDRPFGRLERVEQHAQQRRFPRAAGAHDADQLSRTGAERHVTEAGAVLEAVGDAADLEVLDDPLRVVDVRDVGIDGEPMMRDAQRRRRRQQLLEAARHRFAVEESAGAGRLDAGESKRRADAARFLEDDLELLVEIRQQRAGGRRLPRRDHVTERRIRFLTKRPARLIEAVENLRDAKLAGIERQDIRRDDLGAALERLAIEGNGRLRVESGEGELGFVHAKRERRRRRLADRDETVLLDDEAAVTGDVVPDQDEQPGDVREPDRQLRDRDVIARTEEHDLVHPMANAIDEDFRGRAADREEAVQVQGRDLKRAFARLEPNHAIAIDRIAERDLGRRPIGEEIRVLRWNAEQRRDPRQANRLLGGEAAFQEQRADAGIRFDPRVTIGKVAVDVGDEPLEIGPLLDGRAKQREELAAGRSLQAPGQILLQRRELVRRDPAVGLRGECHQLRERQQFGRL